MSDKTILVARSSMPPFEEYTKEITPLWESHWLTNMEQPMPLGAKLSKLTRNLWRRVALGQTCCGHPGEPGC